MKEAQGKSKKIGGWLILSAIGLLHGILGYGMQLFEMQSSLIYAWSIMGALEIGVLFFEMLMCAGFIYYCGYVALLFFHRRRALPRAYITLLIAGVVWALLHWLLGDGYLKISYTVTCLYPFLDRLIIAAIWVPYFWLSERVRYTFVN